MNIALKWLLSASAVMISAYIIPSVSVDSVLTAIWLALFLGIVNTIIKPILIILTLPINVLTLGLFTFVINASIILLASSAVKGFFVDGFFSAILFGIVLSIVSFVLGKIFA